MRTDWRHRRLPCPPPDTPCGLRLGLLLAILLLLLAGSAVARDFDHAHPLYDGLLKDFVNKGRVDYGGLKQGAGPLDRYLAAAAAVPEAQFLSWDEPRQLAFLFNLYNAATLRLILDHYPVGSIREIGGLFKGPWKQRVVGLFGRVVTLDDLEHGILRKRYNEPRLHLALVCAAKGCPPLRGEAYRAERLNDQLDDQAKRFLADPAAFRIDRGRGVVHLSSLFKWYGDDFRARYTPASGFPGLEEPWRAVMHFCARYLSDGDRRFLEAGGYRIRFLDYDWSLNGLQEER